MSLPVADPDSRSNRTVRVVVDAVLVLVVLGLGAITFTYPFGHDQALYAYVAREWAHHGALPYRDVFDHKTPGIYAVHAITVLLFGENTWGIRVADLSCVLALGWLASRVALFRAPAGRAPIGYLGATVLLAYILHYGFFDFWSTAQSELWYATFSLACVCAVLRLPLGARAYALAGAAGGVAMILKPPAMSFVALAALIIAWRLWAAREGRVARIARALVAFGAGLAVPCAATFGYLVAHHALSDFVDIVVGANGYYVAHEKEVHSVLDVLGALGVVLRDTFPVCAILLGGLIFQLVRARRNRDRVLGERYLFASALLVAGVIAVGMQQKFYWLHWLAVIGSGVVIAAMLMLDLHAWLAAHGRGGFAIPLFLGGLAAAFFCTSIPWNMWRNETTQSIAWLRGEITPEEHAHHFRMDFMFFYYDDSVRTAEWIDEHSTADDTIVVRGFHPEIYTLAHRRYDARFFWTLFLTDPRRAYRREDYLKEDAKALHDHPPRYAVSNLDAKDGIDSVAYFEALGYVRRADIGKYVVLERPARP